MLHVFDKAHGANYANRRKAIAPSKVSTANGDATIDDAVDSYAPALGEAVEFKVTRKNSQFALTGITMPRAWMLFRIAFVRT